jgi:hypothetical protein
MRWKGIVKAKVAIDVQPVRTTRSCTGELHGK